MSVRVMQWVWEHSTAKDAARMVLLAIADCASDDGGNAWPSVPTLAEKANVSVRTVQYAIKRLVAEGLIEVLTQAGPNGVNRYRIIMTGATSAPRKNCTGADSDIAPVQLPAQGGATYDENHAQIAPVTVLEPPIEPSVEPSAARTRGIDTKTVVALAAYFTESVPISNPYRTKTVIAKALGAGVSPAKVRQALTKLIEEGRGCTEDQLRIALQAARGSPQRSTTDERVAQALTLAAKYAIQDNQEAISQ